MNYLFEFKKGEAPGLVIERTSCGGGIDYTILELFAYKDEILEKLTEELGLLSSENRS